MSEDFEKGKQQAKQDKNVAKGLRAKEEIAKRYREEIQPDIEDDLE